MATLLGTLGTQIAVALIVAGVVAALAFFYKKCIVLFFHNIKHRLKATNKFKQRIKDIVDNQEKAKEMITQAFEVSNEARILTIRGLATFGLKDSLLNAPLLKKDGNGFKMKILMLDPKSQFAGIRASEISEGENAMRQGIRFSIGEVEEIRKNRHLDITVRLYNELPIWRLMFFGNVLFVSGYDKGVDGAKSPMHLLEQHEKSHFSLFSRYFDYVWDHKSRPVRVDDYMDDGHRFTFESGIALLTNYGCSQDLVWHCKTVSKVARDIADNAQAEHPELDVELVELGALLHDIGKARSREIDHAYIGGGMVRTAINAIPDASLREKLARIVERHTGAGLTATDIAKLNVERNLAIPEADYVPETIEEKLVALADKMVEGDHDKSFAQQIEEKKVKFGPNSPVVRGIEEWHEEFKRYIK